MKIAQIDAGGAHPWPDPKSGQTSGSVFVEGSGGQNYARGNSRLAHTFAFGVRAPAAIGGSSAGSAQALKYLLQQIHELVKNTDCQPVYLQPFATAEAGAYNAASEYDSWYWLDSFESPNRNNINSGFVKATLQATPAGPATVRRVGQTFIGGALSTAYTGPAIPWVAFSVNSTPAVSSTTRTGSDGAIPLWINPAINPAPFVMPSTIADLFKGGCHVYDTLTVGGNAVPVDGTALNTNWVEVFGPEHVFTGDVIVTNQLHLLRFQLGVADTLATVWLWSTQLGGGAAWQQYGTLQYADNGFLGAVLRQVSFDRIGLEEIQWKIVGWTSAGNEAVDQIRLQRAALGPRVEFRPQSNANNSPYGVKLTLISTAKAVYNSGILTDPVMTVPGTGLAPTADYGYAAAIIPNASFPFIAGLLWTSIPATQPAQSGSTIIASGDTSGPGQNISRQYGLFAIPFPTPQNLQAEAEGGTLAGGTVAVTDAGKTASPSDAGNNAAKIPNTTVIGATGTFGTAWQPPAGNYKVWFRIRCTTATNATANFKWGLYNSTDSTYVQSLTSAANAFTTAYAWYSTGSPVTVTAGKNMRFRFENTGTSADDFFVDEAVLVPITDGLSKPQDIFQQYLSDRRVELSLA